MTNWKESIEWHDRLRHWMRTPQAKAFGEHFYKKWVPTTTNAIQMHKAELLKIEKASLYWISNDMLQLALHAAETMPDQAFLETDVPESCGLMIFEKHRMVCDAHKKNLNVQAVGWMNLKIKDDKTFLVGSEPINVSHSLTHITYFSNTRQDDDYMQREEDIYKFVIKQTPLLQMHVEVLNHGMEPIFDKEEFSKLEPDFQKAIIIQRKLPIALFTLINQPLAVVSKKQAPREFIRRKIKQNSIEEVSSIRIVNLRKIHSKSDTDSLSSHRDWSYRWLVSGHWRNQYVPSVSAHRLQWINSYVKGDESLPLVVKKSVKRLIR
jgi:hypothetical protein